MSGAKNRVVVVDDDRFVLASIERGLRKLSGIDFRFYEDARTALDYASHNQVDLFICDYQMPGMNGLEFMQQVSARYPESRRVILSGREIEGISPGDNQVDYALTKPISAIELRTVIEQLLG